MKTVFIDTEINGHHSYYMNKLIEGQDDYKIILPKKVDFLPEENQYEVYYSNSNKNPFFYLKWINKVNKILKKEKPDVVHFLYGDCFYRFFSFGLSKKYKTVVTFHVVRRSRLRDISLKLIFKKISVGVVHTKSLKDDLLALNINNVEHIEYPNFSPQYCYTREESRNYFSIPGEVKTLLCLGGTRVDKGLDLLLEALKGIKKPFHLLVAGEPNSFNGDYIKKNTAEYKDSVTAYLKYLTDEEIFHAVNASDIMVLPYKRIFDGASGPLTDGAVLKKTVIGPSHGSLYGIISNNHLGYIFESENVDSLRGAIETALDEEFVLDETANAYSEALNPNCFKKRYEEIYEGLA